MQCQQNSCTGCSGCCPACSQLKEIRLRRSEADFLLRFAELPFLPVVRFVQRRFGEPALKGDSLYSFDSLDSPDSLAPVFLQAPSDSLETVCWMAAILNRLDQMKLISISYTEPLGHFNYSDYLNGPAFSEFCARAKGFAVPDIEYGSMALTALGQEVIDDLELNVLPPLGSV